MTIKSGPPFSLSFAKDLLKSVVYSLSLQCSPSIHSNPTPSGIRFHFFYSHWKSPSKATVNDQCYSVWLKPRFLSPDPSSAHTADLSLSLAFQGSTLLGFFTSPRPFLSVLCWLRLFSLTPECRQTQGTSFWSLMLSPHSFRWSHPTACWWLTHMDLQLRALSSPADSQNCLPSQNWYLDIWQHLRLNTSTPESQIFPAVKSCFT